MVVLGFGDFAREVRERERGFEVGELERFFEVVFFDGAPAVTDAGEKLVELASLERGRAAFARDAFFAGQLGARCFFIDSVVHEHLRRCKIRTVFEFAD